MGSLLQLAGASTHTGRDGACTMVACYNGGPPGGLGPQRRAQMVSTTYVPPGPDDRRPPPHVVLRSLRRIGPVIRPSHFGITRLPYRGDGKSRLGCDRVARIAYCH